MLVYLLLITSTAICLTEPPQLPAHYTIPTHPHSHPHPPPSSTLVWKPQPDEWGRGPVLLMDHWNTGSHFPSASIWSKGQREAPSVSSPMHGEVPTPRAVITSVFTPDLHHYLIDFIFNSYLQWIPEPPLKNCKNFTHKFKNSRV